MLKHVPNALTMIRFVLIPFIIISLVNDQYLLTFIFFTVSALTDVLDGFIARKFDLISNFGKLVDPLADKATQISILTTLAFKGIIETWIIVVIFLKEVLMVAGASFLYGKETVVSSKWYGKLATVLFYIAIVSSLAVKRFDLFRFDIYLYYLAIIFTIFSLLMYFRAFYAKGYLKKDNLKITK